MAISLTNAALFRRQAYIDGQWVEADNGKSFAVYNPANGEHLADIASVGAAETQRAIAAADRAMQDWKVRPAAERAAVLKGWHQLIVANQEDLAKLMTLEQGKVLAESRGEIGYGASFVEWFAEEARRVYGDLIPLPQTDRRGVVVRQPVGVVAAITPWNFPNAMITRKVAPALAAGCAIVLKPAAETPLSALALAELAEQAGVPAGVFSVLPTDDAPSVGDELCSNPTVKKLTFTGSTPVGKLLMKQCADTVKRTSMELGGNAPVIIFDDADLDQAVAGALASKYRNAGQTCICANRILVQDSIYDQFIERFSAEVEKFRMGDGMDEANDLGPVISSKALEKIHSLVEDAVADGARVLNGGDFGEGDGHFYRPTVLADTTDQMRIFREEIFGPVAPVFKFSTEEDAIAMANDTQFGLAAYMYSQDIGRVWRVSEAIEYGMVGANEVAISTDVIPFGGVKESGQGREGSKYGLDDYLEIKYICMGGLSR